MARVFGEAALIYIGGSANAVPLANEWSIDIEQEKIESPKVFICPPAASSAWITKTGGYFSASGSISALYDDSDTTEIDTVLADAASTILLYPDCTLATSYWKGDGWLQVSMGVAVDAYVTVDYSWESAGRWQWEKAA